MPKLSPKRCSTIPASRTLPKRCSSRSLIRQSRIWKKPQRYKHQRNDSASLETAPKEAETKRQETAKLPNAEEAGTVIGSYESSVELIRELAAAKANLESLQDELEKVTAQLETVREQRPSLISTRQPEAQSELEATRTELLNPDLSSEATAPGRVADRTVLLAQEAKLLAELEMLKQEKISTTAREELLEARQESLTRQVENSTALTKTLQNLEEAIMKQEAQEAESVVSSMKDTIAEDDLQGQELVAEVTVLTEQLDRVAGYSSQIEEEQADVANRLKRLNEEYQRYRKSSKSKASVRLWFKSLFNYKNEFLIRTSMHYPERPRFPQQTMCDSIQFALTRSFAITLTRKNDSPVGTPKVSKSSSRRAGKYLKNSAAIQTTFRRDYLSGQSLSTRTANHRDRGRHF